MKPFNLKDALAGKKVITRDGREVLEIFHFVTADEDHPVHASVREPSGKVYLRTFRPNGKFSAHNKQSALDLFMAPEKREYWTNLWRSASGHITTGQSTYASEKEAQESAEKINGLMEIIRTEHLGAVKVFEETI